MKKFVGILIIVVLGFIFPNRAYADEYNCKYDFSTSAPSILGKFGLKTDFTPTFKVDTSNYKITPDQTGWGKSQVYLVDNQSNEKYTPEYIIKNLNGGCPEKITVCPMISVSFTGGGGLDYDYGVFFDESNMYALDFYQIPGDGNGKSASIAIGTEFFNLYVEKCGQGYYKSDESSGKPAETSFECDIYDDYVEKLKELSCKKQNSNCTVAQISNYNDTKDRLKNFCSTVLQFANVGTSSCLTSCLGLNDDLNLIEDISSKYYTCGMSERLQNWILNIFKWIKYILPVGVIILGILDFIKSLTSEKDDEMKKTQGRFVKRLIAAVLVFLIPFILEFILEKMGFGSNSCGFW